MRNSSQWRDTSNLARIAGALAKDKTESVFVAKERDFKPILMKSEIADMTNELRNRMQYPAGH